MVKGGLSSNPMQAYWKKQKENQKKKQKETTKELKSVQQPNPQQKNQPRAKITNDNDEDDDDVPVGGFSKAKIAEIMAEKQRRRNGEYRNTSEFLQEKKQKIGFTDNVVTGNKQKKDNFINVPGYQPGFITKKKANKNLDSMNQRKEEHKIKELKSQLKKEKEDGVQRELTEEEKALLKKSQQIGYSGNRNESSNIQNMKISEQDIEDVEKSNSGHLAPWEKLNQKNFDQNKINELKDKQIQEQAIQTTLIQQQQQQLQQIQNLNNLSQQHIMNQNPMDILGQQIKQQEIEVIHQQQIQGQEKPIQVQTQEDKSTQQNIPLEKSNQNKNSSQNKNAVKSSIMQQLMYDDDDEDEEEENNKNQDEDEDGLTQQQLEQIKYLRQQNKQEKQMNLTQQQQQQNNPEQQKSLVTGPQNVMAMAQMQFQNQIVEQQTQNMTQQQKPQVIVKESTVKKSQIDLKQNSQVFLPPQLIKKRKLNDPQPSQSINQNDSNTKSSSIKNISNVPRPQFLQADDMKLYNTQEQKIQDEQNAKESALAQEMFRKYMNEISQTTKNTQNENSKKNDVTIEEENI